ncbi:MAG: hypothetical protein ACI9WU_000610 [Myxococcota bacterium]|jgi:hypothetical protein
MRTLSFTLSLSTALILGCSPTSSGSGSKSDATNSDASTGTSSGTVDGAADGGTAGDGTTEGGTTATGTTTGSDTGGGDTGGGDTGGGDTGTTGPVSDLVDPSCTDGQYTEPPLATNADISDLMAGYDPGNPTGFIIDVLDRRYPFGAFLVEQTLHKGVNGTTENCTEFFSKSFNLSSASGAMSSLGTVVHECGHGFDLLDLFNPTYQITEDLSFSCKNGGVGGGFGSGVTFARSLIKGDEYSQLRTPCQSFFDKDCEDTYAGIYLDGDPTDANFESGDQGFDTVLEETVQYVNSLAVAYAYADQQSPFAASSDRDGILTFLWYVQRYLRMARLEHPAAYELLSQDACWRDAILTVWGRAWMYLEITSDMNGLGIDDTTIEGLVLYPELLEEIDRLRDASGCQ